MEKICFEALLKLFGKLKLKIFWTGWVLDYSSNCVLLFKWNKRTVTPKYGFAKENPD